jgi:hypothetical protein
MLGLLKGDHMPAQMQTYVVRIYRPNGGHSQDVVGVVEIVRSGRKLRFAGFDKLRAILAQGASPRQRNPHQSR